MKIKAYVVTMFGTNCFLVWDEESKEAMLIDPGDYKKAIARDIKDGGLVLKYLLLTHGHSDHYGGVPEFKAEFPDAPLVCSKEDLILIGDTDENDSLLFINKRVVLDADMTIGEGDELKLGSIAFKVLETPGHSKGCLAFYTTEYDPELVNKEFSGTVFSGDTLFYQSIGRTDFYGGDLEELTASVREKLFTLPDDTLMLPGHMNPSTIGNEKKYNPFF